MNILIMASNQLEPVNVAILGTVSAGKSTLLNALFANSLSEMAIRRTTAIPHIYEVTDTLENKHDMTVGRAHNREVLADSTKFDANAPLKYTAACDAFNGAYNPMSHAVYVWDMPGINDAAAEETYYKYVTATFIKWDVVVLVIDVRSALNTSGEISVVQLVLDGIAANNKKGVMTRLLAVINKCDEMEKTANGMMQPSNPELRDITEHIEGTIMRMYTATVAGGIAPRFVCITAELAFVYRALVSGSNAVDAIYLDRIGRDAFGRVWNLVSPEDRAAKITTIIQSRLGADGLENSGFNTFRTLLSDDVKAAANECWHVRYDASIIKDKILDTTLTQALTRELMSIHARGVKACGECRYVCDVGGIWKKINRECALIDDRAYAGPLTQAMVQAASSMTTLMKNLLRLPECFHSGKFPAFHVGKHLFVLYEKILMDEETKISTMQSIIANVAKFAMDGQCAIRAMVRIYTHKFASEDHEQEIGALCSLISASFKFTPTQELEMLRDVMLYSRCGGRAYYLDDIARRRDVDLIINDYYVNRECKFAHDVQSLRIIRGMPARTPGFCNDSDEVRAFAQARPPCPLEVRFMMLLAQEFPLLVHKN